MRERIIVGVWLLAPLTLAFSAACLLLALVLFRRRAAQTRRALVAPPVPESHRVPSTSQLGRDDIGGLIDLLDDLVCVIDEEGIVLRANRAFVKRLQAAENDVRGLNLARFLEKRESLRSDGPVALSIRSRRTATGPAGPCRLGGSLEVTVSPLGPRSRGGRIIEVFAVIIRDVTDLRGHEERARRLGHLVDALPIVVIEADPTSHRVRSANGNFHQVLGWSEEELLLLEVDALAANDAAAQAVRDAVFGGETGHVLVSLRKKGGETFPARVHGLLRRKSTGAPEDMVLMIEDVTRERQAIRQRELLAAAVEGTKDGVVITDLAGVVMYANSAAAALYGKTRNELVGAPFVKELDRPIRVNMSAVKQIDDGMAVAYVAVIHDLTEEREMQEQVLRAQKLATLGELAATVTHEISSPLMYLLHGAEYLVERVEALGLEEEVKTAANDSLEGARRIQAIAGEVRRFAHMGKRGRLATTYDAAIDSAVAIAGSRMKPHAKIEKLPPAQVGGAPVEVFADPGQLAQVLMNLMINAAQAFEDARQRGTIRFEQSVEDDRAVLRVIDDGPGIADEVKAKLFKDYVTTKEPGRGTGFGLRVAQKMLEENGGTITVESEMGKGSTFTIALPIATVAHAAAEDRLVPVVGEGRAPVLTPVGGTAAMVSQMVESAQEKPHTS